MVIRDTSPERPWCGIVSDGSCWNGSLSHVGCLPRLTCFLPNALANASSCLGLRGEPLNESNRRLSRRSFFLSIISPIASPKVLYQTIISPAILKFLRKFNLGHYRKAVCAGMRWGGRVVLRCAASARCPSACGGRQARWRAIAPLPWVPG